MVSKFSQNIFATIYSNECHSIQCVHCNRCHFIQLELDICFFSSLVSVAFCVVFRTINNSLVYYIDAWCTFTSGCLSNETVRLLLLLLLCFYFFVLHSTVSFYYAVNANDYRESHTYNNAKKLLQNLLLYFLYRRKRLRYCWWCGHQTLCNIIGINSVWNEKEQTRNGWKKTKNNDKIKLMNWIKLFASANRKNGIVIDWLSR